VLRLRLMPKDYKCPACQNDVDKAASVCSNPVCRASLAFCSHCRDVTTYTLAEAGAGRMQRDKYKCARCERIGVKCLTWVVGGDCNGLARASGESQRLGPAGAAGGAERSGRIDKTLCAACSDRVGEVGRSVVSWTLIGAFGGLLRPKK
jgi:hypothetical protein